MGASVSTNVAKVATDSIVKIASDIVQNTAISSSSSQIISVTHNKGDVVISGNVLRQKATINMNALFTAMSSEDAQQKLAVEIAQQAKSITSGLNLAQFAASTNILGTFISATIDLSSKISQSCSLNSSQNQSIVVEYVEGNTTIVNNVLDQVADILQTCVSNSVNSSKAIQDVTAKLSQTASASAVGISEWALALMGALLLGIPVVGVVVGGVYSLKYIFPVVTICGMGIIAYYVYSVQNVMKFTAFSKLIENSPDCAAEVLNEYSVTSAARAADECNKNAQCKAVDFKTHTIAADGSYNALQTPIAIFYSNTACNSIESDKGSIMQPSNLYTNYGELSSNELRELDPKIYAYIDTKTSNWYQKDSDNVWHFKSKLITDEFTRIEVSTTRPSIRNSIGNRPNQYYIYIDSASPAYWHIYKWDFNTKQWTENSKKPGPGMAVVVPPVSNTTAFKTQERNQLLLYIGIGIALIGIVGTIYTAFSNKTTKNDNLNNKP